MLKKIRIKNYKNLREAEVKLGPINLIVGPNASGKTALWEAMQRLNRLFRAQEGYDKLWKDYENVVSDGDPNLSITLGCDWETEEGEISYSLTFGEKTIEEETLIIGGEMFLHAWWEKGNLVRHVKGQEPIVIADRPYRWVEPHLAGAVKSILLLEEWEDKLRKVGEFVGIDRWGLFRFFNILDIGKPENMRGNLVADRLSYDGLDITVVLWEMKDKNTSAFAEIKEVMEELTEAREMDVGLSREANTFYLRLMYGKDLFVRLDSWPDGWKQTLLLLTALKTSKNLVFIEEPETHLHPDLFRFVRGQIEEAADKGIQVIPTTHNLSFINQFKFDEVILVEDGKFRRPQKGKWLEECALSLGDIITSSLVEEDEE